MKRFSALFALAALAAATAGMAQQAPPPADPPSSTAQPPASTAPQEQSSDPAPAPSSDPGASTNGQSRQEMLMRECMQQVTAANPGVPANDIKNFCDKEVNQATQPHN